MNISFAKMASHLFVLFYCVFSLFSINSAIADNTVIPTTSADKVSLSVEQVENRLQINQGGFVSQQGDFIQRKYFKVLKKPFLSSGNFVISNDEFIWKTRKPVESAITFNNGELYFKDNSGSKKAPAQASTIAQLLQHLIAGNFTALTNSFAFYDDNNTANCVTLKPKTSSMTAFIEQIILCGDKQVDEFVLFDKNMNRTEISISYNKEL
ncbi:outer membrane lipoprotein carrier protein LolA [Candidatus Colwellia aromaticivorans]|uniref:outer membrane lipoprotein carrier protein LolA n=1 Tax=Candidatus Colwellia aromaticivorans TaxID=2267621 RepID=UPI000DF4C4EF|nr:outer membrane lipoprotein carrier protein LolA [Candidatus Colwellia aromaticivorans]